MTRATREGKAALEDTRRMYEERMEAARADSATRIHAAEERARTADLERQRAEASRQAAHKELTRLQVDDVCCGLGASPFFGFVREEGARNREREIILLREGVASSGVVPINCCSESVRNLQ